MDSTNPLEIRAFHERNPDIGAEFNRNLLANIALEQGISKGSGYIAEKVGKAMNLNELDELVIEKGIEAGVNHMFESQNK